MRLLLLLLLSCTTPVELMPDADTCADPPRAWYRQSDSCVSVVRMSQGRWEELSQLRDDFVVYADTCTSAVCGPVPDIPPIPSVTPVGGTDVEGDCAAWRDWDRAMVKVAAWAECVGK